MAKAKSNANVEDQIEAAEKTLADLEKKREKATAMRTRDDDELARIAFHAHTGDKDAGEKLTGIRERSVRREVDIKSLDAAIAVAKQNVEAAKADERAEAELVALTELRGLANILREAGRQADDALAVLNEAVSIMDDTVTSINRLGVSHPSHAQLMSLGERALKSALVGHPWARGFEHVRPTERRNFAGFLNEWARALEQNINSKLKQLEDGENVAA